MKSFLSFAILVCLALPCFAATPVAHWSLDETSGVTAFDSAGTNDGTLIGAPVWTTGQVNGGLSLDGADDYVEVTGYGGVTGETSRTCAAWIKTTDTQASIITYGNYSGGGTKWKFYLNDMIGPSGAIQVDVSGGHIVGTTNVADGQWHHVAAVLKDDGSPDASEIKLYVDGLEEAYSSVLPEAVNTAGGSEFLIGTLLASSGSILYHLDGQIDEVMIFDTALEPIEIRQMAGAIVEINTHWAFDETEGAIAYDSVGSYDGNLLGGPVWTPGHVAGALAFDGVDDYVEATGYPGITGTHSRTYAAWIKTSDTQASIIDYGDYSGEGTKWKFYLDDVFGPAGVLQVEVYGGHVFGTTNVADGQWHHVAAVLKDDGSPDASEIKLYVDGVEEVYSYVLPAPINTAGGSDVLIGVLDSRSSGMVHYFDGQIDEVMVFDTALEPFQIRQLAEGMGVLDGHWSMDETSGSIAHDSIGTSDADFVGEGDPDWTTGQIDGAISLQGEYLQVTGHPGITGTHSRTCAAWIKTSQGDCAIMTYGDYSSAASKWKFLIYGGQIKAQVGVGQVTGSTRVDDEQWHHVAAVLEDDGSPDVSEIKLYVDGFEEAIGDTYPQAINTRVGSHLLIGALSSMQSGIIYKFDGQMDDVRVYESALEAAGIRQLAGVSVELDSHWLLDETSGDIAYDSINSNDAVFVGAPVWTAGQAGGALDLDGENDYLQATDYRGIGSGHSRTCAAWINTTDTQAAIITYGDYSDYGTKWKFYLNDMTGPSGAIQVSVNGGHIIGTTNVADGNWHHVAAVLRNDGTPEVDEIKLYVDGFEETISEVAPLNHALINTRGTHDVLIGALLGLSGSVVYHLDGQMDDVMILEGALNQDQIRQAAGIEYNANVYWKFDETAGDTAYDSLGSNDGILYGASWTPGKVGGALSFDYDDYVYVPNYRGVTGTVSRTCAAWIKLGEASSYSTIISWGDYSNIGTNWNFQVARNYEREGDYCISVDVSEGLIIGSTNLNDWQWHHVAAVLEDDGSPDVSEVKLYVDGVLETIDYTQARQINTASSTDVLIGAQMGGNWNEPYVYASFNGLMDEVRVYDSALTADGIWELYISRPTDFDLSGTVDIIDFGLFSLDWQKDNWQPYEPNEVAWWPIEEGEGTTVYDSVAGNDGYFVDTPTWTTGHDGEGSALSFDGHGDVGGFDYIEVTGYEGVTGTQSRTFTTWIKTTDTQASILTYGDYSGGDTKWKFYLNDMVVPSGAIQVAIGGGHIYGTTNVADGQWHHVAAVLEDDGTPDVSEIKLYVDGVEESYSDVLPQPINTSAGSDLLIGALDSLSLGIVYYFDGEMDDIRIFDYPLTGKMIQDVYNGLEPVATICTQMIAADFNNDCTADIYDLAIFAQDWLTGP